jgi:hypothetical protein
LYCQIEDIGLYGVEAENFPSMGINTKMVTIKGIPSSAVIAAFLLWGMNGRMLKVISLLTAVTGILSVQRATAWPSISGTPTHWTVSAGLSLPVAVMFTPHSGISSP